MRQLERQRNGDDDDGAMRFDPNVLRRVPPITEYRMRDFIRTMDEWKMRATQGASNAVSLSIIMVSEPWF